MSSDLPVLHGYTVRDLDRMSLHAATAGAGRLGYELHEAADLAWSAMAEALVLADEPPAGGDLIGIGRRAIYRGSEQDARHHGVARDRLRWRATFVTYWLRPVEPTPEELVVDRLALAQILPALERRQIQALWALALHGTHQAACAALDLSLSAYEVRLRRARTAVRAAWFAPDPDPGHRGRDRRVGVRGRELSDSRRRERLIARQRDRRRRLGRQGIEMATDAVPEGIIP